MTARALATFSVLLLTLAGCDDATPGADAGLAPDGGHAHLTDAGDVSEDAGTVDAGAEDAGAEDAGADAGAPDAGPVVNGCTVGSATDRRGQSAVTIVFRDEDQAYTPRCLLVDEGTTVTFSGNFAEHPLQAGEVIAGVPTPTTAGTPLPTSPRGGGTTASFVMSPPGTYGYYCVPHATFGMVGTIFVE